MNERQRDEEREKERDRESMSGNNIFFFLGWLEASRWNLARSKVECPQCGRVSSPDP